MSQPSNRSRLVGPQMRDQSVPVFTDHSTSEVSALYAIRGKNPVITAYNLPADTILWIEMVELTEQHQPWRDACCVHDFPPQEVISINRIRCSQCDADIDASQVEQFARITTKNPVVELNLPYGTYWQLRWDGPGLGEVFVRLWESNRSFDATMPTVTNGCPCIQYVDDPTLWIPTNVIRCNEETGVVEGEFRSPDGQFTAWFVTEPLLWRDTGAIREYCDPATPVANPDSPDTAATADLSYERQQVNQCGYVRWVNANCMVWTATGNDREYDPTSDTAFERQYVNQFGRFRWDDQPSMVWTATGNDREYNPTSDTAFERQYVNQFGRFRWDDQPSMVWTDTGEIRSVCPDANDNYEKQQVNQFGRFRWVTVDCVLWTDTVETRELCVPSDIEYEVRQENPYGGTQWVVSTCAMVWTATGVTRELASPDDVAYEAQEVNPFGRFRWVASTEPMQWSATGVTRELASPDDVAYEAQEVNPFGRFRWVASTEPMQWSATGATRIDAQNFERQEQNSFGRFRWVTQPVYLAPVALKAFDKFGLESSAVNSADSTTVVTTYSSAFVTIEPGFGFIAGSDSADPAATVFIAHPVTKEANAVAIYPEPAPGATVEVYNTLNGATISVVGYARNVSVGPTFKE